MTCWCRKPQFRALNRIVSDIEESQQAAWIVFFKRLWVGRHASYACERIEALQKWNLHCMGPLRAVWPKQIWHTGASTSIRPFKKDGTLAKRGVQRVGAWKLPDPGSNNLYSWWQYAVWRWIREVRMKKEGRNSKERFTMFDCLCDPMQISSVSSVGVCSPSGGEKTDDCRLKSSNSIFAVLGTKTVI